MCHIIENFERVWPGNRGSVSVSTGHSGGIVSVFICEGISNLNILYPLKIHSMFAIKSPKQGGGWIRRKARTRNILFLGVLVSSNKTCVCVG